MKAFGRRTERTEMKIYDISQEVFGCEVYLGDPAPKQSVLFSTEKGDEYNLTAFSMCAHNGTHLDAPRHFIGDGRAIDEVSLHSFVGSAYVAEIAGEVTADDARNIIKKASSSDLESAKRILIKGDAVVSLDAARVFADAKILLLGNESQTVGPIDAPMQVHLELLGAGVVLLEGIRLADVGEGTYFLSAAPLKLGGSDGAPCRAILISE